MHHSHEALDRPSGGPSGGLLTPLRDRRFRLLWSGMFVSLLGDGAFFVALAWQVYAMSDGPTAMSLAGIAMTVPTIALLLVGGVVSDRRDRRSILVIADLVRAAALAALAALTLAGTLQLGHVLVLVAVYGAGSAFFAPAFDAIVPDLLPAAQLRQANALDQLVRPLVLRMAGPALGGVLVATAGAGATFALDAASFAASALLVSRIRTGPRRSPAEAPTAVLRDLRDGWDFVRARIWLWGTFASAAIAYLLFMGPVEVLVPYVVKHGVGGDASDLGLVFAAGGLGSVACAVTVGRRSLPRRSMTFIYLTWTLATLAVAGYGLGVTVWQLMAASLAFNAFETAGTIVWATLKQRHVPSSMLGRVSSLDWLISIGLLPLSFALTGPVTSLVGARATLVAAGVLGGAVTLTALFLPGMRALERRADGEAASMSLDAREAA